MRGDPVLHGVALIRVSRSPWKVEDEYYGVFYHGELQPKQYATWNQAMDEFLRIAPRDFRAELDDVVRRAQA